MRKTPRSFARQPDRYRAVTLSPVQAYGSPFDLAQLGDDILREIISKSFHVRRGPESPLQSLGQFCGASAEGEVEVDRFSLGSPGF